MKPNNTMKLKLLFATLTTIALIAPVAANTAPVVESISIDPSSPEAGEEVTISLKADAPTDINDLLEAEFKVGDKEETVVCSNPYTCDEASFTTQLDEGDYTAKVRVRDENYATSSWKEKDFTVSDSDGGYYGPTYELLDVGTTQFRLSKGDSAQIQADVKNHGKYNAELKVKWFAERNGKETHVASDTEWVDAGKEGTLAKRVSWYEFQRVIDRQKKYNLKAKLYHNGEKVGEKEDGFIYLKDDSVSIRHASAEHRENGRVEFSLTLNQDVGDFSCRVSKNDDITTFDSPIMEKESGSDRKFSDISYFSDGSYTRYLGCLNEDKEQATSAKKVTFSVDTDGEQFGFRNYGPTGTVSSGNVQLFVELDENPRRGWCKRERGNSADRNSDLMSKPDPDRARWTDNTNFAEGRTHTVTYQCFNQEEAITGEKTVQFTVSETDTGSREPSLNLIHPGNGAAGVSRNPVFKWKITDPDNNRMEDTTLYIEESYGPGDKPWNQPDLKYNLEDSTGVINSETSMTAQLDANQEYVWGIVADDGENRVRSEVYSFTTRGQSDEGSEDDDDQGPTASFTVSDSTPEIGQSVKFDASGSDGDIMEYRWAFPDGTTKYGTTVYKRFDSAGKKKIQLRVTEYDYGQHRVEKKITVQRETRDDDGDGDSEESENPVARLNIDPYSAEIGEEVEFDATGSEDDTGIEEYRFDLDGDGDWDVENDDGHVERTFFEEFDGEARVKVTDEDGNTDTSYEHYEITSRGRIYLSDMQVPKKVCDGKSFDATLNVRNPGEQDRFVVLETTGFGDTRRHTISVENENTKTATVSFTAGKAGTRQITVTSRNSNTLRRTIEVLDCQDQTDVSGISVSVRPDRVNIGDSVKVSGYVDDARGRQNVRIMMDGRLLADTMTQPDGYYQVYVYPETVSRGSLMASSGGETARTQLKVLPSVGISSMNTPDNIFQGERFDVCANVESQVEPLVVLYRNGEKIDSKNGNGEVCFTTSSNTAGNTDYRIGAYAEGASDSISRELTIMETKPETTSFPEKIASVESGDGIVKATIYNNQREQRRYNVEMSGLPDTWVSTTDKEVILQPGEQREVFFYLTPQKEGRYSAEIKIDSRGTRIYEEEVEIITGGTSEPQERSLLWKVRNAFRQW